jgi:hypothetical protein
VASNLIEATNMLETIEQSGFDTGRDYDWSRSINEVRNLKNWQILVFPEVLR